MMLIKLLPAAEQTLRSPLCLSPTWCLLFCGLIRCLC